MNTRTMLQSVLALAVASTACQPPAQEAAGLSDEDVAAIRNTFAAAAAAEEIGDWETIERYLTDDFIHMHANHEAIEGRVVWREWAETQSMESTDSAEYDISYEILELDGRDDLAFVRASATYTPRGSSEIVSDIKFLQIWERQSDGTWLLAINSWNSNVPLPEEGTETET
jgi:ketosteroid isomerase-like protein